MEKLISGEENAKIISSRKINTKTISIPAKSMVILLIAIVISFIGGIEYQKHWGSSKASAQISNGKVKNDLGRGGRFNSNRVAGTVSSITASAIAIQSRRTGTDVTLNITSSTQIMNNDQTATTNDIAAGDVVIVTKDTKNTSNAATILVNPSFGGYPSGGGSNNQTTPTPNTSN